MLPVFTILVPIGESAVQSGVVYAFKLFFNFFEDSAVDLSFQDFTR